MLGYNRPYIHCRTPGPSRAKKNVARSRCPDEYKLTSSNPKSDEITSRCSLHFGTMIRCSETFEKVVLIRFRFCKLVATQYKFVFILTSCCGLWVQTECSRQRADATWSTSSKPDVARSVNRMKNEHGHCCVCWMSMGIKNGSKNTRTKNCTQAPWLFIPWQLGRGYHRCRIK